ncbi:hypothetical protein F4801DRAFT_590604 [Xylaria longipes]|nr:hypothetical protein F4801DRAFT_590604 [Xylaria longipes]
MAAPALDAQSHDPFHSVGPTHHRFSHFNAQLFALGPNASPAQAKRALEAHLAETDRRMEEAGKLGTALVQQRNELTERLKEVEKLQAEGELSDDLRQKLVEIERDYNEVARESARAFLPKSRVPSNEAAAGSPFVPEGKGGKRSVSPSKFEAQATASPTKLSVPNRKIRNQPSNRIHDIEFAAEISTSLIAQVRNLQGLLAEKDEELKDTRAENSKLEYEVEGFQQRLKALDDNEHRYKDENWNLETQIHELMAKEKEAADREKKLTQALNILQSEKNAGQRELDEIKLTHSKLAEEHAAAVKHHDIELGTAKRTMVMGESERAAMQKKIEELTGQNTELAKAVSVSIRGRKLERESIRGMSEDDFHTAHDNTTPEQSPPASPVKSTPRHSMLESETLKTSLAHAQRTIQSLRTNVHREKTEKMETRRLLQEARDEIEKLRSDTLVPSRRARKTDSKEFKKPTPRLLGGLRSARSEIFADDPNWEDQPDVLPHPLSSPISRETTILFDPVPEQTDHFETANETSDAAFETANENATETDDFHTGAEEFSSDDAETETESPSKRGTLRGKPPSLFPTQRSGSIDSTASTEDEDFPYEEKRTPTQPPVHARFPLRVSRGAFRRSRNASEDLIFQSSPASIATSSNMGTPQQPAQSLAAELGDFDGSDNESNMSATPSRRSTRGRTMSPPPALPPLPRVIMVDSGMMTEPVHELSASLKDAISANRPVSMNTVVSRFSLGSEYSDVGAKLAEFPSPPTTSPKRNFASMPELALSMITHIEELSRKETESAAAHTSALESDSKVAHDVQELSRKEMESATIHASALEALKDRAARDAEIEALKAAHAEEISEREAKLKTAASIELEALKANHAEELSNFKTENAAVHAAELAALKELSELHAREFEDLKSSHADQIDQAKHLKASHLQQIDDSLRAAHAKQLEDTRNELTTAQATAITSLTNSHNTQLDETKTSHTKQIDKLERLKASHVKQLEELGKERDAAHATVVAALADGEAAMSRAIIETLNGQHAAAHAKELEGFKAAVAKQIDEQIEALNAAHAQIIEAHKRDAEIAQSHALDALNTEHAAARTKELETLTTKHLDELKDLRAEHAAARTGELEELTNKHLDELKTLKSGHEASHSQLREELEIEAKHLRDLELLRTQHEAALATLKKLGVSHSKEIEAIRRDLVATNSNDLESLQSQHVEELATHSRELEILRQEINATHSTELESLSTKHAKDLEALRTSHSQKIAELQQEGEKAKSREVTALASNAALTRELDALKAEHELTLESHIRESAAENENLLASHAAELEALRASLTVMPPALGYSPLSSVETEPVELPEIKSPRREAFIIPQDKEPMTPHGRSKGRLDRQLKTPDVPVIAEDDTRQSPSAIVRSETPDSQQPFKEITANTDARALRKPIANMSHQGSQTMLTADGLDKLMKNRHHQSQDLAAMTTSQSEVNTPFDEADATTPSTAHRRRPSTDSFGSVVRTRHPSIVAASEPTSVRRPGSSASVRSATLNRPPLPLNHREVIEAVRSHSAHGGKGTMAPPLLPASTYRPSSSGPQTPSNRPPLSPSSVVRGTPTPRAGKTPGYVDVQAPARIPMRSRQSSMSSFASEIDTRFNIHNGMGMDPSGFGSSTDPRMIQAVTQTMIGEYLWKYTRKAGRGEMSENRHRRFFWVHPYTRALYWSDSDPAAGGRGEMRAKSVPIEAVRVVADDNPMPPGLHRKSLVVIAPGRTVKFTCTTGQRHETWFNALSYLLLRSSNENKQDSEEVTGNITQEDVDEFNPSINRRSENSQRPRPPPSLSSYNSRTTRNESPSLDTSMTIPTLTPTHEKEAARSGTFGKKLSGYWRSSSLGRGTFNSLRGRSYQPYDSAIYEASEVPDSAEDLRQIIEQQDRESDRLENVRACCDGKIT